MGKGKGKGKDRINKGVETKGKVFRRGQRIYKTTGVIILLKERGCSSFPEFVNWSVFGGLHCLEISGFSFVEEKEKGVGIGRRKLQI